MIRVIFKNLEKSDLVRHAVAGRIEPLVSKFPDLEQSRIHVTVEMQNSPFQAGLDVFSVKLHVHGGRYAETRVEKSAPHLYQALAEVVDHMLEKLNRLGDRQRVKQRRSARMAT